MDPSIVAENNETRARLAALVNPLGDAELERSAGDGWTVAMALAHLAFWDRRAALMLGRWQRGQVPPADEPEWASDWLNDSLVDEWRAVAPREAARLAVAAAEMADRAVESVGAAIAEAILARGERWRLARSIHRQEHIGQITRALRG
jgi:hypothetical protein